MNLPNKITLSRIFLVPLFMIFVVPFPAWMQPGADFSFGVAFLDAVYGFLCHYKMIIAAAIFILASSTDGVDGYIARKRKQITRFGKFLDPIADKLLITAALLALVQTGEVSGWAAMIIIGRELIVTGLRLVAAGEGIVIAASYLGKIKTVLQIIAIVLSLLQNWPLSLIAGVPFDDYFMFIAVIFTIYSGYDYIAKNLKVIDYNV